ncbi:MAG: GIY-YIG nuclease family protein [Tissierellia bacterium]|nr:GIY-YIG nuclease family protein [Tissierellia bacterium]
MHYIYIVECSDKSLYTGYTRDLEKRIKTHNEKKGAKYTRGRTPVVLKYYEEFDNKSDAMKREAQIKKLRRHKKEQLIELNAKNKLYKL